MILTGAKLKQDYDCEYQFWILEGVYSCRVRPIQISPVNDCEYRLWISRRSILCRVTAIQIAQVTDCEYRLWISRRSFLCRVRPMQIVTVNDCEYRFWISRRSCSVLPSGSARLNMLAQQKSSLPFNKIFWLSSKELNYS